MKIEIKGYGMVIFILLLILKLTHAINWSWWYVTLPLWMPIILLAAVIAVITFIKCCKDFT